MSSVARVGTFVVLVALVSCDDGPSQPAVTSEPLATSETQIRVAPGREVELWVGHKIPDRTQTHPITTPIIASVLDPTVATLVGDPVMRYGTDGWGARAWVRVRALKVGATELAIRPLLDTTSVRIPITVFDPPDADDEGLVYSAAIVTYPPRAGFPIALLDMHVDVTISNPTAATKSLWMPDAYCRGSYRLYTNPALTGTPALDARYRVCEQGPPERVVLLPGASVSLGGEGWRLSTIPDTSLNGTFYVAATVDRVRDVLNVPAGTIELFDPNKGLEFFARSSVHDEQVHVTLGVTNTNTRGAEFLTGGCLPWLVSKTEGGPTRSIKGHPNRVCGTVGYVFRIEPGATFTTVFEWSQNIRDILKYNVITPGRYYLTLPVAVNNRTIRVPAGMLDIPW